MPEVMLDYCFVRRSGEEEKVTILLAKDRESRAMRAWVMRSKATCTKEAAARAAEGIHSFGHKGRLLVKTDNEPALTALREEVGKLLENGIIPVRPPEKES